MPYGRPTKEPLGIFALSGLLAEQGSLTCLTCMSDTHGGCTETQVCKVDEMCFGLKQLVHGGARYYYGCKKICTNISNLISTGVCCNSDYCNKDIQFPEIASEHSYSLYFKPTELKGNDSFEQSVDSSPTNSAGRLTCYTCNTNVEGGCAETQKQECEEDEMCYGFQFKVGNYIPTYRYGCRKECTSSVGPFASRECCNSDLCNNQISFKTFSSNADTSEPLQCLRCKVGALEDCKTIEICKSLEHFCYVGFHDTVKDGPHYHLGCRKHCNEGIDLAENKTLACCNTPLCNGNILPPTLRPPFVDIPESPSEATTTVEAFTSPSPTTEGKANTTTVAPSTTESQETMDSTDTPTTSTTSVAADTTTAPTTSTALPTTQAASTSTAAPTEIPDELTTESQTSAATEVVTSSATEKSTTIAQTTPTALETTTQEICEDHNLCTLLFPGLGDCSDSVVSEHCKVSCGHCDLVSPTIVSTVSIQDPTTRLPTSLSTQPSKHATISTTKLQMTVGEGTTASHDNQSTDKLDPSIATLSVSTSTESNITTTQLPATATSASVQTTEQRDVTSGTTQPDTVTASHATKTKQPDESISTKLDPVTSLKPDTAATAVIDQTTTIRPDLTTAERSDPSTTPRAESTTTTTPVASSNTQTDTTTALKQDPSTTPEIYPTSTTKPDPTTTSKPVTRASTQTDPTTTIQPDPTTTTQRDQSSSTHREPTTSTQQDSKLITKSDPSTTIQPDPLTNTQPQSSTAETEAPSTIKTDFSSKPSVDVTTTVKGTPDAISSSPTIAHSSVTERATTSTVQLEATTVRGTTAGDQLFIAGGGDLPEFCSQPDIPDCSDPSVVCDSFTLPFCPHKCGAC